MGIPGGRGEAHPGHRPTVKRQRHCRRYGRANKHPRPQREASGPGASVPGPHPDRAEKVANNQVHGADGHPWRGPSTTQRTSATLAALPENRRTPPAVVATEGVHLSGQGLGTRRSACGPSAVTSRRALGEALLGLQQPTNHHQLAHQVVQGLFGSLPVRIGDRLDQQRVSLPMLLRGHPPRVRHPPPSPSALASPPQLSSGSLLTTWSWRTISTTSTKPKAARSRRRAASWSSSTSDT